MPFAEKGKTNPLFKELARLVEETHGIWNEQAENSAGTIWRRYRAGRAITSWRGHHFALRNRQRWLPGQQTGCGDKNKIDGLAVTAMRQALMTSLRGRVVIGEGEIDHAPMLWIGEEVGKGDGPEVDIAVDPIEGTRMVAMGQSNARAVMAFAPRDSLLHAPDMYMKKLVVNRLVRGD